MDLGSVLSYVSGKGTAGKKSESYLALKLSASRVSAAIWSVVSGRVEIGAVGQADVDFDKFDSLLAGADKAVSEALGGADFPAVKVIFGVPPNWVTAEKIVEEKLSVLRRLCRELDLRPLGYVLLPEALENFLKEKESAPLTAILLGVEGPQAWVTVYRAGKNLGTVPILSDGLTLAENAPGEIEKALKQFPQVEVLPARIVLYNGRSDLEPLAEKITAYPWTKQLPFLHFPKVETLTDQQVVQAVAVAGGVQLGGKIAASLGTTETEEERAPTALGEMSELKEVTAASAGFTLETNEQGGQEPAVLGRLRELETQAEQAVRGEPALQRMGKFLTRVVSQTRRLWPKVTIPAGFGLNVKGRPLALPLLVAALGIVVALGVLIYFVPKARAIVRLSAQPFDREMEATISGQLVEVSESGSRKGVITGRKLVGDKATGAVTLYSAAAGRSFTAGSTISSPEGLKFTLDREAGVASASDFLSPATVTVKVTAADIGDKYNLPAGTRFTIGSLSASSYLAKNDSAFSGGNSHEATVVTAGDQNRLLATLSAELTQKAQGDLNAKLDSGQTLLPNAMTWVVAKKKFSKDVDAEADTLNLDLMIDYKGVVVSKDELVERFAQEFATDIPSGFYLETATAEVEIKSTKIDKNDKAVLQVRLRGKVLPEVNQQYLMGLISGKSLSAASEALTKLPGIAALEIESRPRLAEKLFQIALPWRQENIRLELVSD